MGCPETRTFKPDQEMRYNPLIVFTCLVSMLSTLSCQDVGEEDEANVLARVKSEVLLKSDAESIYPKGLSKEDSLQWYSQFINNWAVDKLLFNFSKYNLEENTQQDLELLVEQYRTDLYVNAYIEALVAREMDTIVTTEQARKVYEDNKSSFVLNEALIKLRYIKLKADYEGMREVKRRFSRFNSGDQAYLDSISIQFKSFFLNDSVWVRSEEVIQSISILRDRDRMDVLKKPNFVQLQDSIDLYLVQVNAVLARNETAPLLYVMPTVRQIVLNQRKLNLVSELKKDAIKDALNNRTFEIYE